MQKYFFPILIIVFFLSLCFPCFAQRESVTIITYYPAPYGNYKYLEAKKSAAVGDIGDSGTLGITEVDDLQQGELFVEGNVTFGTHIVDPPIGQAKTGELIYFDDTVDNGFKYFDGTDWMLPATMGGMGGCYVSFCGNRFEGMASPSVRRCSFNSEASPANVCLDDFSQVGDSGRYGFCYVDDFPSFHHRHKVYHRPPADDSGNPSCDAGEIFFSEGSAYLCCKDPVASVKACYISYCDSADDNCSFGGTPADPCIGGFAQQGSSSTWGYCEVTAGGWIPGYYFRPPHGNCDWRFTPHDIGNAYLCCK